MGLVTENKIIRVLVNPQAGKGKAREVAQAVASRLKQHQVEYDMQFCNSPNESRQYAKETVGSGSKVLMIVGGDGTLSTVLDELLFKETSLALIPAGTGNDFARSMNIPFGTKQAIDDAVDLVLTGEKKQLDVGKTQLGEKIRHFLTIAAIGFDALVSERTNRLSWPKGALRYYLALIIELIKLKPFEFEILTDTNKVQHVKGILTAVANTKSYGGGMPISPEATPFDGLFDVTLVKAIGRLKLIRFFPLLLKARHLSRSEIMSFRCQKICVSGSKMITYADGEKIGLGSICFSVLPKALNIILPKNNSC